jgi:hypothetical protein
MIRLRNVSFESKTSTLRGHVEENLQEAVNVSAHGSFETLGRLTPSQLQQVMRVNSTVVQMVKISCKIDRYISAGAVGISIYDACFEVPHTPSRNRPFSRNSGIRIREELDVEIPRDIRVSQLFDWKETSFEGEFATSKLPHIPRHRLMLQFATSNENQSASLSNPPRARLHPRA